MSYRVPYLSVTGPDGSDMIAAWGSKLIGVKIVTRFSDEHDECTFTFTNDPPYMTPPDENTPYTVQYGWSQDSAVMGGVYYSSPIHLTGDPKRGETIQIVCRSGLTADLEQADSRHFNAENGNNTLGDVFQNLFSDSGMPVQVSPRIAALPLPGGHLVQWQQSKIDFATDLASQVGGLVKPMGGKILVLDRSSGESVTGQGLNTISIVHDPGYEYNARFEPRFKYHNVGAAYLDDTQGRLKSVESADNGDSGAKDFLPHPAPDEDAAKSFAKAMADEYVRFSGTGMFVMPGYPGAVAGALCTCSGFPPPINTVPWIAAEVTHDINPDEGWITTVETETNPG